MKGKVNVKTIIVLLILVIVGVLMVFGVKAVQTYITGADEGIKPESVNAVSSDDGKSATITWMTGKASVSMISWGSTPVSVLMKAGTTDLVKEHSVVIENLKPGSTYYYNIIVNGEAYNDGVPYSFKTLGSSASQTLPTPTVASESAQTVTPTSTSTSCDKTTDYNKDGVVNSLDYYDCLKGKAKTTAGACNPNADANGDGKTNSLDILYCKNK
jgi:hypothetical protein